MSRSRSAIASVVLLGSWLIVPSPRPAGAQGPGRPADQPTPIASTRPIGPSMPSTVPTAGPVRAMAKFEGVASPGLRVTLDGSASSGGRLWYRWVQTQGPKVAIDDPTRAEAHFAVPPDASLLGFVLVVGDSSGVDARPLLIEVDDPDRPSGSMAFKADAGDDQPGRVGRRVVLNGTRSEPRGKLRFRWIQTGGPKVTLRALDGPTCSFTPTVSGTYQFALVVASAGGDLSEPATVTVNVAGSGNVRASTDPEDGPSMAIDELARVALASIDGGVRYADDLSRVFDTVADRIDSYRNYTEANTEMSRRLDAIVPRDKSRRAVWVEQLFAPLMAKVVTGMRTEGLDLAQPDGPARALTRVQRARLAEQFRYTAAGLRASKTMR